MKFIKKSASVLILGGVLTAVLLLSPEAGAQQAGEIFLIDDFENDKPGRLPYKWYNQKAETRTTEFPDELRSQYKYEIREENGNKYLHYNGIRAKHLNFPLADEEDVDITRTPVLHWKWRIHTLPKNGNEDKDALNDVAASIYVVFDMGHVLFKKVPKSIRYTWSSTLPEGTELSKLFGNQRIIVMGSGEKNIGTWQTFERNIVEDYKRLFGDNPPKRPLAILILSDGDSTDSPSSADYDDIYLKSRQ